MSRSAVQRSGKAGPGGQSDRFAHAACVRSHVTACGRRPACLDEKSLTGPNPALPKTTPCLFTDIAPVLSVT